MVLFGNGWSLVKILERFEARTLPCHGRPIKEHAVLEKVSNGSNGFVIMDIFYTKFILYFSIFEKGEICWYSSDHFLGSFPPGVGTSN